MRRTRSTLLSLSLIQVNKFAVAVVVVRLIIVHRRRAREEVVPLIGLPDWSVTLAIVARVVFLAWHAADHRLTTQAAAVTAMIRLRPGARPSGGGPMIEDCNREQRLRLLPLLLMPGN